MYKALCLIWSKFKNKKYLWQIKRNGQFWNWSVSQSISFIYMGPQRHQKKGWIVKDFFFHILKGHTNFTILNKVIQQIETVL